MQPDIIINLISPENEVLVSFIRIYRQTIRGGGGVPKLIYGSHRVIPEPRNSDDLVKILHNSLGSPNLDTALYLAITLRSEK